MNSNPQTLEYRLHFLEERIKEHFDVCSIASITRIEEQLENLTKLVEKIDAKINSDYVTRIEFNLEVKPLKKIVYGLVSLILVAVVGAILNLIIR